MLHYYVLYIINNRQHRTLMDMCNK